jgi:MoxR-like ATPase
VTNPLVSQFSTLRTELRQQFFEREDAIDACLLAMVCGHHVFLLGPPGTAKTQLIRAIMSALRGHRYFEVALSRNRPLEAVIGPLDILKFRETGEYIYRRKGYATDSEFILLNEAGKMSDDLGHDLLALLNERLIHEVRIDPATGQERSHWPAPLSTAFCDSNEELTSADASDNAAALWDRLVIRTTVGPVTEDSNFAAMLVCGEPVITAEIEWSALKQVIDTEVPAIEIPSHVQAAMVKLRHDLDEAGVHPSSRRFHQSMDVLRASAWLDGRDVVTEDDIANLRFTLWDIVDQIPNVDRICRSASNPYVGPLMKLREGIHELKDGIESRHKSFVDAGKDWKSTEGGALQMYGKEVTKKLETVRTELDAMLMEAAGRPIPGFKAISDLQQQVLVQNFVTCLEQPLDVAKRMAEKPERLGQGDGGNAS